MLDTFGIPEYFVTHVGSIEDAGGGMIRIVRCVERGGVLIPVFSSVTPALAILKISPTLIDFAQKSLLMVGAAH